MISNLFSDFDWLVLDVDHKGRTAATRKIRSEVLARKVNYWKSLRRSIQMRK